MIIGHSARVMLHAVAVRRIHPHPDKYGCCDYAQHDVV